MNIRNSSFDDHSNEELNLFSGYDLLLAHLDEIDLDWQEVTERAMLDQRRGLVVLQVSILEELIDEYILYLADDPKQEEFYTKLTRQTIGPRIDRLERLVRDVGLIDDESRKLIDDLRAIVGRRNQLAHGTLHLRPAGERPTLPLTGDIELEWVIISRRSPTPERITMSQLRDDLNRAIGCFMAMLSYSDRFIKRAPHPQYFTGGQYIVPPR